MSIGSQCFIGVGVSIRDGISIADNSTVGMGSVVVKSITESGTNFGNPCKSANIK